MVLLNSWCTFTAVTEFAQLMQFRRWKSFLFHISSWHIVRLNHTNCYKFPLICILHLVCLCLKVLFLCSVILVSWPKPNWHALLICSCNSSRFLLQFNLLFVNWKWWWVYYWNDSFFVHSAIKNLLMWMAMMDRWQVSLHQKATHLQYALGL